MVITIDTRLTALSLDADDFIDYNDEDIDEMINANGARLFSDATLETIINTIAAFVFANAPSNAKDDLVKAALIQLVSDEFNNRLFKRGLLKEWTPIVVMDKNYLMELLPTSDEESDPGPNLFFNSNTTEW